MGQRIIKNIGISVLLTFMVCVSGWAQSTAQINGQ